MISLKLCSIHRECTKTLYFCVVILQPVQNKGSGALPLWSVSLCHTLGILPKPP